MRKVSAKQAKELKRRAKLKRELIILSQGRCMKCGQLPIYGDANGDLMYQIKVSNFTH